MAWLSDGIAAAAEVANDVPMCLSQLWLSGSKPDVCGPRGRMVKDGESLPGRAGS
jgi:hypothetical protein